MVMIRPITLSLVAILLGGCGDTVIRIGRPAARPASSTATTFIEPTRPAHVAVAAIASPSPASDVYLPNGQPVPVSPSSVGGILQEKPVLAPAVAATAAPIALTPTSTGGAATATLLPPIVPLTIDSPASPAVISTAIAPPSAVSAVAVEPAPLTSADYPQLAPLDLPPSAAEADPDPISPPALTSKWAASKGEPLYEVLARYAKENGGRLEWPLPPVPPVLIDEPITDAADLRAAVEAAVSVTKPAPHVLIWGDGPGSIVFVSNLIPIARPRQ
jgi:hypothetical protein